MEQRISMFEIMFDDMRLKLEKLSRKKDERDDIIIELFKMLKTNMQSREDALKMFDKYMKKEETKPPHLPPFFLRLKRKK